MVNRAVEQPSSSAAVISKIKKLIHCFTVSPFHRQKGFTLIELAIVLVIIGIIIGAVLKGQDLVDSARHKKLTAEIKQWEVAAWTYLDRKGRFPGDQDKNGTIGNGTDNVKTDFNASGLAIAPSTNALTLGSSTFYLALGNAGNKKNIIAVCTAENCGTAFADDELIFGQSVDTFLDGEANGTKGRVYGTSDDPSASPTSATWTAVYAANPSTVDWTSGTKALLYYFDRKP